MYYVIQGKLRFTHDPGYSPVAKEKVDRSYVIKPIIVSINSMHTTDTVHESPLFKQFTSKQL